MTKDRGAPEFEGNATVPSAPASTPSDASPDAFGEAARREQAAVAEPRVVDKRKRGEPTVEEQLERARSEAAEHLDDLKRLKAEFENYRKRVLKEQTQLVERASQQLVERLMPVLDNFELALIAADRTKDYDSLVRGVEIVYGELMDLLHKEGLQKIDALGRPFDPTQHEAVLEVGDGPADGDPIVAEVVRNGYTLKGKVLRPAMVKVVRN